MDKRCTRPPPGWTCTRGAGHDGPCAATKALDTAAAAAAEAFSHALGAGASATEAWQAVVEAVLEKMSQPRGPGQVQEVKPSSHPRPGVPASRPEDMSEKGRLHLFPQDDGDMVVRVVDGDDERHVAIEFCASGGRSPHTLQALRDLSHAMSRDNAEAVRS